MRRIDVVFILFSVVLMLGCLSCSPGRNGDEPITFQKTLPIGRVDEGCYIAQTADGLL